MFDPVFQREAQRVGRHTWICVLRWVWVILVFFLSVVPMLAFRGPATTWRDGVGVGRLADGWVQFLVLAHLVLAVLAAPVVMAGALTEEKNRGTLQLLLTTELSPRDILLGKLLGQTLPLSLVLLVSLPLLCFLAAMGDLQPVAVLALVLLPALLLPATGTLGLLASVWTRTTAQALWTALFALGALAVAVEWPDSPLHFLSPLGVLRAVWGEGYPYLPADVRQRFVLEPQPGLVAWRLAWFVPGWVGVIVGGLTLAAWRLRPVCLAQLEGRGRKKERRPGRARPPVGADPLCWKECYVEGLSTQASRGRTPFWLELGVVFALWAGVLLILCGDSIDWKFERVFPLDGSRPLLMPEFPFFMQGLTVLVVGTVLIAVRGAGAISREKQRHTWETLLLTDLTPRELVRGKFRGILWAFYPYLAAALLPALLLSWTGGWVAGFWPVFWAAAACLTAYFMAAVGISQSATATSAWERLGLTLVGGFLLGMFSLAVVMPLGMLVLARGGHASSGTAAGGTIAAPGGGEWLLLLVLLVLWWPAWAIAEAFLTRAENAIQPRKRLFAEEDWDLEVRRRSRRSS
jgi:ABC-type transport system involved in multi-copper enzyme maturation permease subunit